MSDPPLPGVLADIERVAGREAALMIARACGGTDLWVPERPRADSRLAELVGITAAEAVAREVGYGSIRIPRGAMLEVAERRRRIGELLAQGLSHPQIARQLGISTETVRIARRRLESEDATPQ